MNKVNLSEFYSNSIFRCGICKKLHEFIRRDYEGIICCFCYEFIYENSDLELKKLFSRYYTTLQYTEILNYEYHINNILKMIYEIELLIRDIRSYLYQISKGVD